MQMENINVTMSIVLTHAVVPPVVTPIMQFILTHFRAHWHGNKISYLDAWVEYVSRIMMQNNYDKLLQEKIIMLNMATKVWNMAHSLFKTWKIPAWFDFFAFLAGFNQCKATLRLQTLQIKLPETLWKFK